MIRLGCRHYGSTQLVTLSTRKNPRKVFTLNSAFRLAAEAQRRRVTRLVTRLGTDLRRKSLTVLRLCGQF